MYVRMRTHTCASQAPHPDVCFAYRYTCMYVCAHIPVLHKLHIPMYTSVRIIPQFRIYSIHHRLSILIIIFSRECHSILCII